MIREKLQTLINAALQDLDIEGIEPILTHPDEISHGDYTTNVALVVANIKGESPLSVAENIAAYINTNKPEEIERVDVAGPGFINFYLSPTFFTQATRDILDKGEEFGRNESLKGEKIMVEYTDPNVFKPFHVGHLMSNCIGEAIARLFEASGAEVVRANYQGDVGMHVAKALWGIRELIEEKPSSDVLISDQIAFIGKAYVLGAKAYEEDEKVQKEIKKINKHVYEQNDEDIEELYQWGRKISLDHFEEIYAKLGTRFDHYFFESDVAYDGIEKVKEQLAKGVFEESDGAVIFDGEKYGLHKRVFINSEGIPTYEAKDIGLNMRKFNLLPDLDRSIIITANEQSEYFKVVLKALEQFAPEIVEKTTHISHGMMRGIEGKFSSRKGNAPSGEELLSGLEEKVREIIKERDVPETVADVVSVGAIKYSILKQSIGKDIIFDVEKSISFEGDSGPYFQYAYTRAQSVINKAREMGLTPSVTPEEGWEITELERLLYQFPEIVERSAYQLEPHHLATYLTRLASVFNSFYASERIADSEDVHAPYKVALTSACGHVLENGLKVLGIQAPQKM